MTSKDRRYPRLGSVVLKARALDGAERFDAYVTSLSEGGGFLVTDREIGIGQSLAIDLRLPFGLGAVTLEAETLYAGGPSARHDTNLSGFGVRFLNVEPSTLEKLRGYVDGFRALAESLGDQVDAEEPIDLTALGRSPGE